jgi:hypothetical protein
MVTLLCPSWQRGGNSCVGLELALRFLYYTLGSIEDGFAQLRDGPFLRVLIVVRTNAIITLIKTAPALVSILMKIVGWACCYD